MIEISTQNNVLKTAQMGQVGIRSVMSFAQSNKFRDALRSQKKEYDSIEREVYSIASSRGWELQELNPMTKLLSNASARTSMLSRDPDSKIAEMMINGNTKGMIKNLKNLHQGPTDSVISAISQKLIDTEYANIRQMRGYL